MNKNELFSLLNKVFLGEDKKEKFFDTKTTDGKILRIDGDVLQKGADVYLILEDGTIGAVDDGNYILETGETVIVTGNRVADFIPVTVDPAQDVAPTEDAPATDAPAADAPATDVPVEDAPAGDVTPSADVVEEIVSTGTPEEVSDEMDWAEAVKALAEEIASLKETVASLTASNQAMESHIAQFSKLPSGEQIKKEKTGFKNETVNNKGLLATNLEKIRAIRNNK